MFIDSEKDHITGVVNTKLVIEWLERLCDGIERPHFITYLHHTNEYIACLCHHIIQHNWVIECLESQKAIVVGSECVKRAEGLLDCTFIRQCQNCRSEITALKCIVDGKEVHGLCKVCADGRRILTVGKYKAKSFQAIYETAQSYCRWVAEIERPKGDLKKFQDWLKMRELA